MGKKGWIDDIVSEERTLEAMDFCIKGKQAVIDKLIADNLELEETIKKLREEIVFLEHLRTVSIN